MASSPEYLQAISERDAALAQRDEARAQCDEARAAFERLLGDLEELIGKHRRVYSPGGPIADQVPTPEPPLEGG
jgi:hypothetical protein